MWLRTSLAWLSLCLFSACSGSPFTYGGSTSSDSNSGDSGTTPPAPASDSGLTSSDATSEKSPSFDAGRTFSDGAVRTPGEDAGDPHHPPPREDAGTPPHHPEDAGHPPDIHRACPDLVYPASIVDCGTKVCHGPAGPVAPCCYWLGSPSTAQGCGCPTWDQYGNERECAP